MCPEFLLYECYGSVLAQYSYGTCYSVVRGVSLEEKGGSYYEYIRRTVRTVLVQFVLIRNVRNPGTRTCISPSVCVTTSSGHHQRILTVLCYCAIVHIASQLTVLYSVCTGVYVHE